MDRLSNESKEKLYYWIKLKKDFFEDDTIVWLEEQENGVYYINFYLKLLLKSLDEEGTLVRYVGEMLVPYDAKSLAQLTNTPVDTVRVALDLFVNIGLIQRLDAGEIYLTQIDEMIGSETAAAQRMRRMRARENALPKGLTNDRNNVQKCYEHIEIEKEIEKELDNTIGDVEKVPQIPYKKIIDYLNDKANTKYRNVKGNQDLIKARFNEGYKEEEFYKVIDNMTKAWIGTEWEQYLRPSTLFNNGKKSQFDNYLNWKSKELKKRFKQSDPIEEKTCTLEEEAELRKRWEELGEKYKK